MTLSPFPKNLHLPIALTGIWVLLILLAFNPKGRCDSLSQKIEAPVKSSIDTRIDTQEKLDAWDQEKTILSGKFNELSARHTALEKKLSYLMKQAESREALNTSLKERISETERIANEIEPFIESSVKTISLFIETDTPFLKKERVNRLNRLKEILNDAEVSMSEKFRKVMEALFIEAEYGNTTEVYQEKIQLENKDVLVNVFRLGRIALFCLSLDGETAGYYSHTQTAWEVLPEKYKREIHAAIEMASKRRPADLLRLPLGRIKLNQEGKI